MIYTITLNPCLDRYLYKNGDNVTEKTVAGGKGINVSLVLHNFKIKSKALFFAGGETGDILIEAVRAAGIDIGYVRTAAPTRVNKKTVENGRVTEENEKGARPSDAEAGEFMKMLSAILPSDTAVVSGSVPGGDVRLLEKVLEKIKAAGARLIIDLSGKALAAGLRYAPYLVKPNIYEISEMLSVPPDINKAEGYGKRLLSYGVSNVLLSLGEGGAYLIGGKKSRFAGTADAGRSAVNATGAGDSMIAGYLFAEASGDDPLLCAVSAGSATAYAEGLCTYSEFSCIRSLYGGSHVREVIYG